MQIMKIRQSSQKSRRQGQAVIEFALMVPWIIFLFVGVLDFGFYAYAVICTQNAARAVAMAQATGGTAGICGAALNEMSGLPNMPDATTSNCTNYPSGINQSGSPALLYSACASTLTATTNSDTSCTGATACADCTQDASSISIRATVGYETLPMIPIPGLLMGQMKMQRTAEIEVIQ